MHKQRARALTDEQGEWVGRLAAFAASRGMQLEDVFMFRKFVIAAPLAGAMALCASGLSGSVHAAQYSQTFDTAPTPLVQLIRDGNRGGGGGGMIFPRGGGGGGGGPRPSFGGGGGMRGFGGGGGPRPNFGGGGGPRPSFGGGGPRHHFGQGGPRPGFGNGTVSTFPRPGSNQSYKVRPWIGDTGGRPHNGRPHDGRPHDGRPHDGRPHDGRPHDGRPQDGRPHDGKHHHDWKHNRIRRHGRHLYWGGLDYYYYEGYYYGDCEWLKERAVYTGSLYWWRRYEQCRYYDWY